MLYSRRRDPRDYQIAALLLLLVYGLVQLSFDVRFSSAIIILGTALLTQYLCLRATAFQSRAMVPPAPFEPRSALISGLSFCLLLRTTSFSLAAQGAVWVSPGQWGNVAFFAFLIVCLGGLVVNRAARADVSLAFLAWYIALLFGRSFWLGEPLAIPLHRLQNGGLLIFVFFMISDPKTTPDSRTGRLLFALLVALGAGFVQFKLFRTNGLLWSLAAVSLMVPIIDRLFPGERYQWRKLAPRTHNKITTIKVNDYEPIPLC